MVSMHGTSGNRADLTADLSVGRIRAVPAKFGTGPVARHAAGTGARNHGRPRTPDT